LKRDGGIAADKSAVAQKHGSQDGKRTGLRREKGIELFEELPACPRRAVPERQRRSIEFCEQLRVAQRSKGVNILPREKCASVECAGIFEIVGRAGCHNHLHTVSGAQRNRLILTLRMKIAQPQATLNGDALSADFDRFEIEIVLVPPGQSLGVFAKPRAPAKWLVCVQPARRKQGCDMVRGQRQLSEQPGKPAGKNPREQTCNCRNSHEVFPKKDESR
jgi:hypothetical protein